MGRIVVNKHFDDKALITVDKFTNKGELIISNEDGYEGIFIMNKNGEMVFIGPNNGNTGGGSSDHVFLSSDEYQVLIQNGSVEVNGELIVYDDKTFYAVYDGEEGIDDITSEEL